MARNGSGTYSLPAGNPVVTGTVISSSTMNTTLSDIATALTASIAKDGQTPITANMPFANFRITGLGAATAATDAAQLQQLTTNGTQQASTSGTSIDFTSIPSWAKRITISLVGVSTNGSSVPLIQIGDAGGVEATGYLGSASNINTLVTSALYTTGMGLFESSAAGTVSHGIVTLVLVDSSTFSWAMSGIIGTSNSASMAISASTKALSAALDRVRITTVNGTDAFDAGAINIQYS